MTRRSRAIPAATLMLAALLPSTLAGQGVSVGVSGGLSLANLRGDDVMGDLSTRTGFNIGGFVDFPLGGIVFLAPGLAYVQKGAEVRSGPVEEFAIDYLEIPLLLRVAASDRAPFGIDLLLGPTFAFQVRCDAVVAGSSVSCDDDTALSKTFDLGAAFGVGVSYAFSPGMALLATALWDLGLTSIDESPQDRDVKNETILLNLGVAWRLGR